jgi:hypothetical protein
MLFRLTVAATVTDNCANRNTFCGLRRFSILNYEYMMHAVTTVISKDPHRQLRIATLNVLAE